MSVMCGQCDLPSHKASPPIDWYQIILLGDRGTLYVNNLPRVALDKQTNTDRGDYNTLRSLARSVKNQKSSHSMGFILNPCGI